MSDPLDELARANESRRVSARRVTPSSPPPIAQPVVFVPVHGGQRVSGDASSFRWGFGLMFGALCAVVVFIILGCLGLRFLVEAASSSGSPSKTPAAPPAVAPSGTTLTAKPIIGGDGKLQIELHNDTSHAVTRAVVLVSSQTLPNVSVRITFTDVPAGESTAVVVQSRTLQDDARASRLPDVRIVEQSP
jgi:hypothetical protein